MFARNRLDVGTIRRKVVNLYIFPIEKVEIRKGKLKLSLSYFIRICLPFFSYSEIVKRETFPRELGVLAVVQDISHVAQHRESGQVNLAFLSAF